MTYIHQSDFPNLVFLCLQLCTNGEDGDDCLDLAYCNLIQGDIARDSEKFGKDPAKYYKEAEDNIVKYTQYNQTRAASIEEGCQTSLKVCEVEAPKMAVDGLNFPAKYQDLCSFVLYSRSIFDCKNMKKWPATAINMMSGSQTHCTAECLVDEDQNITINNGRKLVDIKEPIGQIEFDTDLQEIQKRGSRVSQRKIHSYIQGFEDRSYDPPWSVIQVCNKNTWAVTADYLIKGDYLVHLALGCQIIGKKIGPGTVHIQNIESALDKGPGHTYQKNWDKTCYNTVAFPGTRQNSLLIGISIHYGVSKKYGPNVPYLINYLCANNGNWRHTNLTKPDSKQMVCTNGTAICSVQGRRNGTYGHLLDVRVGCCEPSDYKDIDHFVHKWEPLPLGYTVGDGLFNLQKRQEFLFWDEVYNQIITRYNNFFSPTTIIDEGEWMTTKCAPGTFVNGFDIRNPKSCYFQGRRILEITFICNLPDGSKYRYNELNIYSRLKHGQHSLQEFTFVTEKSYCSPGYYTGIKFIYYTNNIKQFLVNGWGLEMTCSIRGNPTPHTQNINSVNSTPFDTYHMESGSVQCEPGKAICGFQNKIVDNHRGAFEGLFFKVICCPVN